MTEYVAVRPFIKFPVQGNSITDLSLMPNGLCPQNRRKFYDGYKAGGLCFTNLKSNHYQKTHSMKCYCLGTLISTAGDYYGWIHVTDQVFLMASIVLTHMAGAVTADGLFSVSGRNKLSDDMDPNGTSTSGSTMKNEKDSEVRLEFSWDTVKCKLTDLITAVEIGTKLENEIMESGENAKQPSSLSAIAVGPRFRLMWASFQWLKDEVDNISKNTSTADLKNLQKVFSDILQRSSLSICTNWLKDELLLKNRKSIKEFPAPLFEKLKGDDSVLQNVKKSGKEDLYAELLYILRFGSLSQECCYDSDFFASRGGFCVGRFGHHFS